ncbi:hypothetical protein L2E82_16487 [Cichorium intybus]|uniref:Uncharacterized protein n=1 Tax=Cichorium intybus TaxID=13427 RepID=A0ACB9F5P4_CICIN|nr:hypothetical protein L2E82_16487 [Cichorium intybus]
MDGVGGTITTAIAIDKDKNSHYAVKWALENVVDNMSPVVLLHVLTQTTSPDEAGIGKDGRPPTEAEMQQFFQPFCALCALKGVRTKEIVLQDSDASNALVLYVTRNAISHLVVGSRSRLTRAFKSSSDVASSLQRSLPDTCNLYAVTKSRNQKLKSASQSPAPNTSSVSTTQSSSEEVDLWSKPNCKSGPMGFGRTPYARSIARRVGHDDFTVKNRRDNFLACRTLPGELHDFKILDKLQISDVSSIIKQFCQ